MRRPPKKPRAEPSIKAAAIGIRHGGEAKEAQAVSAWGDCEQTPIFAAVRARARAGAEVAAYGKGSAHLAPEHQRLYLLMNNPSADFEDHMKAARSLAPIMHKPPPPRGLTPEEARQHAEYVHSLLGGGNTVRLR